MGSSNNLELAIVGALDKKWEHNMAQQEMPISPRERALAAFEASGIDFSITEHGPVKSLEEAAAARGVSPAAIVKTLVVRRGESDYLFALVPGDRQISWPKFRKLLGVSRVSMPDAPGALAATGYERGTITPFGSLTAWPVIADQGIVGNTISLGAGAHGVAATVNADQVIAALGAIVADISD